tara:strand:+ start:67 stop:219 length:153 start_codon:yes stop_codon:yes gene_type:complete
VPLKEWQAHLINIQPAGKPIGGSQAIFIDWDTNLLHAESDTRKEGCAIRY